MSEPNDRDKWINLSVTHEKEVYDLQGIVATLVRLQLETLEERNKAEAENERLRSASFVTAVPSEQYEKLQTELDRLVNLVAYLKKGKPFTKHEDDIRRGLRTK